MAACLVIKLIANSGPGKGSDPPLPRPARRGDSAGEHSLSLWPEIWVVISVCISSYTGGYCRSKVLLFSSDILWLLSGYLWGCFLAFRAQASVQ